MRTMLLLKPDLDILSEFVVEQSGLEYNSPEVGATLSVPSEGYVMDRTRLELGSGELIFEAAKSALGRW